MKVRFTLFQKIMTVLFVVLQLATIVGDIVVLLDYKSENSKYYFGVNLGLCVLLLAVFLLLIFFPKIGIDNAEDSSEKDIAPVISASRTYMCFIAVDIGMIFSFVMYFAKYVSNPALWVIVFGVTLFIIGAAKYIIDSRNIGIEDFDNSDDEETVDDVKEPEKLSDDTTEETPTGENPDKTEEIVQTEEKNSEEAEDAAPISEEKPSESEKSEEETSCKEDKTDSDNENTETSTEQKDDTAQQTAVKAMQNVGAKSYPAKKNSGKKKKKKK